MQRRLQRGNKEIERHLHLWETPQTLSQHQQGDKVVQQMEEQTLTSPSLQSSHAVTMKHNL